MYEIAVLSNFFLSESKGAGRYEEHLASKLDRSYWIRILLEKVCCLHECRLAARTCLNIFVRSSRRRNLLTLLARNFSLLDEYLPSFLFPVSFCSKHVSSTIFYFEVDGSSYNRHIVTIASRSPLSFAISIKRELLRVFARMWTVVK